MTTLELYRKHKAGDVSREKFLYEVRRDPKLPWILNTTSYDDAVKILKNKSIISEAYDGGLEDLAKMAKSSNELRNKPITKTIAKKAAEKTKSKDAAADLAVKLAKAKGITDSEHITQIVDLAASMVNEESLEETSPQDAKAVEDAINTGKIDPEKVKAAAEKAEKGDSTDLALLMLNAGRLFEAKKGKKKQPKELHIDVANPYEYRHGIQHELTEMDDYSTEALEKAKSKVLKNLAKDPLFYSNLLNVKQSPYKFKAPETDKPGMQAKADGHLKKELKKDEKANVKDTLGKKEEGSKHPKGVKEMTMTPKKAKGIKKTMAVPGKEKTIKLKEHHNDPNFPGGQAIYDLLDQVATDWGKEDLYNELEDVIVAYSDNGRLSNAGLARLKDVLENYDVLEDYQYLLDKLVVREGLKLMDFFLAEDRAMFADEPADAEKYKIKKDLKGKIVQATNDEGDTFSMNDEAIAIDNGQKIKIAGFEESQSKVKALYNAGMFFSSIDIDGLKPVNKGFRPGVDLGKSFEKFKGIKEYIKSKLKTEDAAKDNQAKQAAIVAAGKELDALRSQLSGINNDTSLTPDEKNKKKAFLQSKINDATKRAADLRSGKVTYP